MARVASEMGKDVLIECLVNGTPTALACQESCTITRTMSTVDVGDKATMPYEQRAGESLDVKIDFDGLRAITDTAWAVIDAAMDALTPLDIIWTNTAGTRKYASFLPTSLGEASPRKGPGTRTASFEAADAEIKNYTPAPS